MKVVGSVPVYFDNIDPLQLEHDKDVAVVPASQAKSEMPDAGIRDKELGAAGEKDTRTEEQRRKDERKHFIPADHVPSKQAANPNPVPPTPYQEGGTSPSGTPKPPDPDPAEIEEAERKRGILPGKDGRAKAAAPVEPKHSPASDLAVTSTHDADDLDDKGKAARKAPSWAKDKDK